MKLRTKAALTGLAISPAVTWLVAAELWWAYTRQKKGMR